MMYSKQHFSQFFDPRLASWNSCWYFFFSLHVLFLNKHTLIARFSFLLWRKLFISKESCGDAIKHFSLRSLMNDDFVYAVFHRILCEAPWTLRVLFIVVIVKAMWEGSYGLGWIVAMNVIWVKCDSCYASSKLPDAIAEGCLLMSYLCDCLRASDWLLCDTRYKTS